MERLELERINDVFREEGPARLLVQAYDPRLRVLTVALTFDGGPREDDALVIAFAEAAVFHLPTIIHQPGSFALLPATAARRYVPQMSFDEAEFGPSGYRIVAILDQGQAETGYYVAAEGCTAHWFPKEHCVFAW